MDNNKENDIWKCSVKQKKEYDDCIFKYNDEFIEAFKTIKLKKEEMLLNFLKDVLLLNDDDIKYKESLKTKLDSIGISLCTYIHTETYWLEKKGERMSPYIKFFYERDYNKDIVSINIKSIISNEKD